ncbi:MAG: hypothetical protein H3C47_06480 [Candidatus Cloacimonetes bacterium]|nr:hypothetical protein [Candidatus Cloacimonadota bacterium]
MHPIKPVESESFKKFVDQQISNRSRDTLFLILTHSGLYPNDEVERLHAEAKRLYGNIITEDRILVVDSLLRLIHCDLSNNVSVQEIRKSEKKKKILAAYKDQAEDEQRELIDVVYEASRFETMIKKINEFSTKAPNLQLQEILEKIKSGYENQEERYSNHIELKEIEKKDPQLFAQEINRIHNALEEYKLLTQQTKEDVKTAYSGRDSSWQMSIEALKARYPELISSGDSIEIVRKHVKDAADAIADLVQAFSRDLTKRLHEALEKVGKTFKDQHKISIPVIDLDALEQKSKDKAFKEEKIYKDREEPWWKFWWWFRDKKELVGTEQKYDENLHLDSLKQEALKEYYEIVNALPNKFKEVLNDYLEYFSKEMTSVITVRQRELEAEKRKKQSNEQIIAEIQEIKKK